VNRLDHILTMGTAGLGLGGAVIAQSTQSPGITLGAIALSMIGLLSLSVRSHYQLATARLDVARITTELEIYRRLCARENTCPFTPTGEPACTLPDVVDRRVAGDRRRRKDVECPGG
jgi:hypothetical protein